MRRYLHNRDTSYSDKIKLYTLFLRLSFLGILSTLTVFGLIWFIPYLFKTIDRFYYSHRSPATLSPSSTSSSFTGCFGRYVPSPNSAAEIVPVSKSSLSISPVPPSDAPHEKVRDKLEDHNLTVPDVLRLLLSIDTGDIIGLRDKLIIMLMISYGLRSSQIERLNVCCIKKGGITLQRKKYGPTTWDRMPKGMSELMERYLDGRTSDSEMPLFLTHKKSSVESRLIASSITSIVKQRLLDIGIDCHDRIPLSLFNAHILVKSLNITMGKLSKMEDVLTMIEKPSK